MFATTLSYVETDAHPCTCEHLDQSIDTEQIDPATHKIADARLRHSKQLRGLRLGDLPSLDEPGDLPHELRSQLEAFCFLPVEAEIAEHIPTRSFNLGCHGYFLFRVFRAARIVLRRSFNLVRANSVSSLAVFRVLFSNAWST